MFFFQDKRLIYIVLGILILMNLANFGNNLLWIVLSLPGVIIAITFHEFAHAWAADKLGDDTPRYQGRLTLNPLSHIDPVGIVLLIFARFGWGKPVQINPRNFNRKYSMSTCEALVSVAGPVMNFILVLIFTIILFTITKFAGVGFITSSIGSILIIIIQYTIKINIGLGVFNLIPLPPLDGSKIFMNFMPYKTRAWIIQNERIFYFIFLAIWITGIAGLIISPIIELIYSGVFSLFRLVFGLF